MLALNTGNQLAIILALNTGNQLAIIPALNTGLQLPIILAHYKYTYTCNKIEVTEVCRVLQT